MWPQPRMHLTVPPQAAGVLERLATLFAHVRPLTCVLPQVVLVVRAPFECKRAVRTLERSYSRMYLGNGKKEICEIVFNKLNSKLSSKAVKMIIFHH